MVRIRNILTYIPFSDIICLSMT